ncbi:MAG: SDR family oxidoreductase [Anaerolineales bacterium]|nr:SDR family oxidoreductase [Anaerolineales bacterium]MCB0019347.1 SDR family oxidoreductase [Anaerolineales bacterium]MCB8959515.1 SDR family oxidoreductase [Ardenticatenales bacterium]
MDFTGKVVLVTGGSRGIGRAVALDFARRGATVAVHYNSNRAAADETIGLLPAGNHIVVQAELADPAAIQQMVQTVAAQLGRLDILVNNAGIYEDHRIMDVDYAAWQASWGRIIDVNLLGAANAAYCAAQVMRHQATGGRIVNVSSRGAFRGEPTAPAYGASKAGMNAMGQSLAKALAPYNIFVGTVAPGYVETDMAAEHLASPAGQFTINESPLKRVAKPEEVAYAVVFLASEGSQFMTGAILDVNGASYLRT